MIFLSGVFRFLFRLYQSTASVLRVTKLKLLYPGIQVDYKTTIGAHCSIICVKGGRLSISNCNIKEGTHILADENSFLSIADSFIGRNCVITAKESVVIQKGCLIAEMVVIRDQDHLPGTNNQKMQKEQFITAPIRIEENVWVASKATVLKGVTIGTAAVIAASAVVNKNVSARELWGGIPARFIKKIVVS